MGQTFTHSKHTLTLENEKLNEKYGLDYFSDSDLESESDEGEDYRYEHNYEKLI